jgi:hypothetical protein
MMPSLDSLLQRMQQGNAEHRAAGDRLTARLLRAIDRRNLSDISSIVRDAANAIAEGGDGPLEAGDADGLTGDPGPAGARAEAEAQSGSGGQGSQEGTVGSDRDSGGGI